MSYIIVSICIGFLLGVFGPIRMPFYDRYERWVLRRFGQ